jgi:hypothetical protein
MWVYVAYYVFRLSLITKSFAANKIFVYNQYSPIIQYNKESCPALSIALVYFYGLYFHILDSAATSNNLMVISDTVCMAPDVFESTTIVVFCSGSSIKKVDAPVCVPL